MATKKKSAKAAPKKKDNSSKKKSASKPKSSNLNKSKSIPEIIVSEKAKEKKPILKGLSEKSRTLNKRLSSLSTKIIHKSILIGCEPPYIENRKVPLENPKNFVQEVQNQQSVLEDQVDNLQTLYAHLSSLI